MLSAGNAATGLWVRCGTWSSSYLTDGFIPMDIVRSMGRRADIERAITARLWVPTDEGMLMPDYLDYNPSRGDVERRRKDDSERKRRVARERRPRRRRPVRVTPRRGPIPMTVRIVSARTRQGVAPYPPARPPARAAGWRDYIGGPILSSRAMSAPKVDDR